MNKYQMAFDSLHEYVGETRRLPTDTLAEYDAWLRPKIDQQQAERSNLPEVANKRIGSDFNEFYIEAIENYAKSLEQKLRDIKCGDCGKDMLECRCDDIFPDDNTNRNIGKEILDGVKEIKEQQAEEDK